VTSVTPVTTVFAGTGIEQVGKKQNKEQCRYKANKISL